MLFTVRFQSFCQTVITKTNDTIICIPKNWVDEMIVEIQNNDDNKSKIVELEDTIIQKNKLINQQDTMIDALFKKIGQYKQNAETDKSIRILNEDWIKILNKKNKVYRHQRNIFILLSIVTTTLILTK